MKKNILKFYLSVCLLVMIASSLAGQIYFTRNGEITFSSDAPLEKITAHNHSVNSVVNLETGQIEFAVLIKAFQFKKALMQQHFNENYLESDKYPKATFKGTITEFKQDLLENGTAVPVELSGTMTIHGISNPIETTGTLRAEEGTIFGEAEFELTVDDYDIKIPKIVSKKIAEVVLVSVKVDYKPMHSN